VILEAAQEARRVVLNLNGKEVSLPAGPVIDADN
jgi:hypothetical protein